MALPWLLPFKGFSWHQKENLNLRPQPESPRSSCPHRPLLPQGIPQASLLLALAMLPFALILEDTAHPSSSELSTDSPPAWLLLSLLVQLQCHLLQWMPLGDPFPHWTTLLHSLSNWPFSWSFVILIIMLPKSFFQPVSCLFVPGPSHSLCTSQDAWNTDVPYLLNSKII